MSSNWILNDFKNSCLSNNFFIYFYNIYFKNNFNKLINYIQHFWLRLKQIPISKLDPLLRSSTSCPSLRSSPSVILNF